MFFIHAGSAISRSERLSVVYYFGIDNEAEIFAFLLGE